MATTFRGRSVFLADRRFFAISAIVMALLNVAGFSFFAAMGFSSFRSPVSVHIHAVLFMGWVALFVTQASLAATGSLALHRRLGWLSVGWAAAMVVVGTMTTVFTVQKASVPFFFLPAQFLVMNPLSVLLFAALLGWGVAWRRDREWHPRLILSGMAAIMGPAFGRLVPAPALLYSTLSVIFCCMIAFPLAGMVRDRLRHGRIHPAWWVGLAALFLLQLAAETLGRSPLAAMLYDRVAAGTPGAQVPALRYQPPPFAPAP